MSSPPPANSLPKDVENLSLVSLPSADTLVLEDETAAATARHANRKADAEAKAAKGKEKRRLQHEKRVRELGESREKKVRILPCGEVWPHPVRYEDGLRRVDPYNYTYNTYCKERWRGRPIIEVFESEFRDRPREYYQAAIESGQVYVNGERKTSEYVMRNGDMVSHTLHRHEPPVTDEPIGIIHEDDDMIVLNKPAGIPVHPAGRYQYNCILEMMRFERGRHFLPHPCNRLDRLTSGIMFVAKNPQAAIKLCGQISGRTVRKEYIARVTGNFPDGEVVCNQPILAISPKLGLNRVRAAGKHARTVFKKLAYYPPPATIDTLDSNTQAQRADHTLPEGKGMREESGKSDQQPSQSTQDESKHKPWKRKQGYSIVRCLPVTGRTHQLRVHLQFLGHPIQNDPIYANQRVWGIDLGVDDADGTQTTDEDVISRLSRMGKDEVAEAVEYYDDMVDQYEKKRAEKMSGETCEVCDTPLYSDPGSHELRLYLHSLRYEDADGAWAYESPLPNWALPPEGMSGPTAVGGMEELVEVANEGNPEIQPEQI